MRMAEGGFFSGIGDVIEKIKRPQDLLLFVGLGLFGWSVVKGPFTIDNSMLAWGVASACLGMAIRLLSESVSWVGDNYRDYRFIHWGNIFGGSVFGIAAIAVLFHLFSGRWVPFHK
jgi:hypothetical protein